MSKLLSMMFDKQYQKLDWVYNNGRKYINTGIYGKPNTRYHIKFGDMVVGGSGYFSASRATSSSTNQYCGVGGASSNQNITLTQNSAGTPNNYRVAGYTYVADTTYNSDGTGTGRLECLETKDVFTGTQNVQIPDNLATSICVCAYRSGQVHSGMRLYEYTLWIDGVAVRNYIPVRRLSDGVAGVYDTITKTFDEGLGTGTWSGSDEIYHPALNGTEAITTLSGQTSPIITNNTLTGGSGYLSEGWDNTGLWKATFKASGTQTSSVGLFSSTASTRDNSSFMFTSAGSVYVYGTNGEEYHDDSLFPTWGFEGNVKIAEIVLEKTNSNTIKLSITYNNWQTSTSRSFHWDLLPSLSKICIGVDHWGGSSTYATIKDILVKKL